MLKRVSTRRRITRLVLALALALVFVVVEALLAKLGTLSHTTLPVPAAADEPAQLLKLIVALGLGLDTRLALGLELAILGNDPIAYSSGALLRPQSTVTALPVPVPPPTLPLMLLLSTRFSIN